MPPRKKELRRSEGCAPHEYCQLFPDEISVILRILLAIHRPSLDIPWDDFYAVNGWWQLTG